VVGPFEVGVWKHIRKGWGVFFRYFLDMKWGIEPRIVFGLIYGGMTFFFFSLLIKKKYMLWESAIEGIFSGI
jgi:hypothetical protein